MRVNLILRGPYKGSGPWTHVKTLAKYLPRIGIEAEINGKGSFDVYHYHDLFPPKRRPAVITVHGTPGTLKGQLWSILQPILPRYFSWLLKKFDAIISVSQVVNEELELKVPVLGNPVDLEIFRPRKDLAEEFREKYDLAEFFVGVGMVQKRKGVFEFEELARRTGYEFVWIGAPPKPWFSDYFKLKRLMRVGKARFLGYVTLEELVGALSGATALVFPSHSETFGLAIVEAAACRTPVVTFDLPYARQFDFVIRARDIGEMEQVVRQLKEDQNYREDWAQKAFLGAKKYDAKKYAEALKCVYEITLQ